MTTASVGHKIVSTILYLDQNGNPMITGVVVPDSPPVWTGGNNAVETLSVSADGATATWEAVGAGTDTVTLTLIVGGKTFTAQAVHNVTAAPQVLTSITIAEEVL